MDWWIWLNPFNRVAACATYPKLLISTTTVFARVIAPLFIKKACGFAFPRSTEIANHCNQQKNDSNLQDRNNVFTRKCHLLRSQFYGELCSQPHYSLHFLCRARWLAVNVFCRKVDAKALFTRSAAIILASTVTVVRLNSECCSPILKITSTIWWKTGLEDSQDETMCTIRKDREAASLNELRHKRVATIGTI